MRRRDDGVSAVFVSDLARAVETAEIAFAGTGIPVELDWRLREVDYGDLNGAAVEEIEPERAHRVDVPFPGGESYRDAVERVGSFLDDVRASGAPRILVIGHTATRWALDHLLAGEGLEDLVARPFGWQHGWEYIVGRRLGAAAAVEATA